MAAGFLKVPEGKVAKNRLHLDLWVSGGRHVEAGQRDRLIRAMVDRLLAVGGTVLEKVEWESLLDHVVLQDPEGNELCVA